MRIFITLLACLVFSNSLAEMTITKLPKQPEIRAQLTAQSVIISSEISAKISKLSLKEGNRFQKGQLLINFDCSEQLAQLEKAKADKQATDKIHNANLELAELNSVSTLELDSSKTNLLKADAEFALITAILKKCTINAPFSGRISEKHAEQHEYLKAGTPILDIIDDSELTLTLLVPSKWLTWLKKGSKFKVFLEETQKKYPAKVISINARIDAVSQSIKIKAVIVGKFKNLLAGMSGRAIFPKATKK